MQRILLLTNGTPWPSTDGFKRRVARLIDHLRRKGHTVHLAVFPGSRLTDEETRLQRTKADDFVEFDFRVSPSVEGLTMIQHGKSIFFAVARRVLRMAAGLHGKMALHRGSRFSSRSRVPGFAFTRKQQIQVQGFIERGNYDVILVEHLMMASAVRRRAKGNRLWIIDTIDVMHKRLDEFRRQGLPIPKMHRGYTREVEKRMLEKFDVVLAIQDEEKRIFEEMLPGKTVVCVGMDYPVNPMPCQRNEVTFIGAKGQPNVDGISRFLREGWGDVVEARPVSRLSIYGRVGQVTDVRNAADAFPESVTLHGAVDDLDDAYKASVIIAPMWAGSGLKIKVVEALCRGKAVVTTPVGAQGMANAAGTAMLVVDSPSELAAAAVDLLENPRKREALQREACRYAKENFSSAAAYGQLDRILAQHDRLRFHARSDGIGTPHASIPEGAMRKTVNRDSLT